MDDLEKLISFFPYNNNYYKKVDADYYAAGIIAPGTTSTILTWTTDKRGGAFSGFIFNLLNFAPPVNNITVRIQMDGALMPQSGEGQVFNYLNYLNIPVPYFRPFDDSGVHYITCTVTNNTLFNIFPAVRFTGFYIT